VDGRLVIVSPTSGSASSVVLRASSAADARQKVLGGAPTVAIGQPAQPAVLEGKSKLNRPVDLGARSIIRLQVDDGQVQDIDCRGEDPTSTFPDEAVDRINAVFPGLASLEEERRLVLRAEHRVALLSLRCFTLFEFPPVPSRSAGQAVQHGTTWSVRNSSVRDEPAEWVLTSHTGVDRPRLTRRDTGNWVQVNAVIPGGFTLHVRPTDEDGLEAWMEAPGRASHNLSSALEAQPGPEALCLPVGESRWLYNDCFGDRFDAAYFGHRPRRGRRPRQEIVPGHFAGGEVCHSPGTFNLSRFYDAAQPGTETVFGSRQAEIATQATSAFVYLTHQAARFELRLPRDLPPQLGGRFNTARFAGEGTLYGAAIFDLPEDPRALDEQVKARPAMVTAHVALVADEQVPIYDVPFNTDRPLVGGSHDRYARAYLRQPGVPGLVELRAKEPGEWGNLILITAPDAETPGAYDITATYTGQDVFENARQKVAEQVAYARAAGIMAEVTRR
jgi:hypothetical protein